MEPFLYGDTGPLISVTTIKTLGAFWVFSAVIGALEPPTEKSSALYKFVFRFLQLLAANIVKPKVEKNYADILTK